MNNANAAGQNPNDGNADPVPAAPAPAPVVAAPAQGAQEVQPAAPGVGNHPTIGDVYAEFERAEYLRLKDKSWRKVNMRCVNAAITCFEKKQREVGATRIQTVPEELARKIFSFLRGEPGAAEVKTHPEKLWAGSEFAITATYTNLDGQEVRIAFSGLPRHPVGYVDRLDVGQNSQTEMSRFYVNAQESASTNSSTSRLEEAALFVASSPVPVRCLRSLRLSVGQLRLEELEPSVEESGPASCALRLRCTRVPWKNSGRPTRDITIGMCITCESAIGGSFATLATEALDKLNRSSKNFYAECERNKPGAEVTLTVSAIGHFCTQERRGNEDPQATSPPGVAGRFKTMLELCAVHVTRDGDFNFRGMPQEE
ncbi:unnamed protein product [Amoebophrya sp. A120]|nr:unnamed protein product [Amoebophrya sp. A120]|eukprot:GSA120T00026049001.1